MQPIDNGILNSIVTSVVSLSKNTLLSFDIIWRQPMTDRIESFAAVQFHNSFNFTWATCQPSSIASIDSYRSLGCSSCRKSSSRIYRRRRKMKRETHPTTDHHHDNRLRRWLAGKAAIAWMKRKWVCLRGYLMASPRRVTCFTLKKVARIGKGALGWGTERGARGEGLRRLISLERSIKAIFITFCLL